MGNTEHMLCWLWLTTKKSLSPEKITTLLEYFETPEEIYRTKSFAPFRGIGERALKELSDKSLRTAERTAEQTAKINTRIIAYDDELFPDTLRNIPVPPYVLYVQGALPRLEKLLAIGVVGTRDTTDYGRAVTNVICSDLARAGAITVGGLARGIDSVGAWATLDAGGTAVGVVGNGLDIVYPSENVELMQAITEKGCVISEYPPGSPPLRHHFPARNRIIAGLSRGILVTEAPVRSGSLITAHYALDSGRDVFAVPRPITDTGYLGTNRLIQLGAKLVNNAEDILSEYPYAVRLPASPPVGRNTHAAHMKLADAGGRKEQENIEKIAGKKINAEKYNKLNSKEKDIINTLKEKDMQIDEMARALGIGAGELNTKLFMLEVNGYVKKLPGCVYQLKL